MKRFTSILGVTLLEVMLVLAIAAMIIVMSVRYYQSASSSQQANTILQQIQGIVAAADSLAQGIGSYSGMKNSTLMPLLPGGAAMSTPWGNPIKITSTSTTISMDIGKVPSGVCPLLFSKLGQNNHFTVSGAQPKESDCPTSGDTTVVYTSNA